MGHVTKTPAGTFRANWRDPSGRQRAKTFKTKRAAAAFLTETEGAMIRGTYVDPHAGRMRFGEFADRWLASRSVEATTRAAWSSRLRAQLQPYWGRWQIGRIDHLAVQEWVTELAARRAAATVASCFGLMSSIMSAAVRSRVIAVNPCEGVRLPARRRRTGEPKLSQADLRERLLPAVPEWHRPLVAVAAGSGLRWGECLGLRWANVDLESNTLTVDRVVIEVSGSVWDKPYPKTARSRRVVPLVPFVRAELLRIRAQRPSAAQDRVLTNRTGRPMLRSNFRRQVWRPALVRAGLLGKIEHVSPDQWRALWAVGDEELAQEFPSEAAAVAHVAKTAEGGLRFHDLRHCYATWLVSSGVPVNVVQAIMGHEHASTTLDVYTGLPPEHLAAVTNALRTAADDSLTREADSGGEDAPMKAGEGW